jgi:leucyl/phenylalanyl-tRNA--protein transferase
LADLFSPDIVLHAYKEGYFPMADSKDGEIFWHSPDPRAIFDIHNIKIPKSLRSKLYNGNFKFSANYDFPYIINKCAERNETWINDDIIETYIELHNMGVAHSIETWQDEHIVGGLYGVAIGGAFFGESMFNTVSDASKAAFFYLTQHLVYQGFTLLDSQYINNFTKQLGAFEIDKELYLILLKTSINLNRSFI